MQGINTTSIVNLSVLENRGLTGGNAGSPNNRISHAILQPRSLACAWVTFDGNRHKSSEGAGT